jgi:hypothetical protein
MPVKAYKGVIGTPADHKVEEMGWREVFGDGLKRFVEAAR